ncbi:MAG TPA: DNA-protecting protein DprA [Candidatus Anaerobiospirillum pullistercoris]|uniref:DNA-protecting protein DprA n=1 Tax=Candidatus Anaerobiospirillum pullistercoris TaxID=2838452 RepID=A0A9D1WCP7_9GAMM|nr:DNA-protecting protein DprA [Candidatus Anaerobiospirillum pullistercoris]
MALTAKQIIAFLSLPSIGKTTVQELGSLSNEFIDDNDLYDFFTLAKIKRKSSIQPFSSNDLYLALQKAEIKLEQTQKAGINWVTLYDPNYPAVLRDVRSKDGKRSAVPIMIYYKGNLQLLSSPSIAIIGSRNTDKPYTDATQYLAGKFAARGLNIVSGLALGCDTAAHLGALDAGTGKTIAILGNGLDTTYPRKNKALADKILEQEGLLLSEYSIGTNATKYTLVARDLIQAGISKAVIVAQTRKDGGSMHAAIAASSAKKLLYVVKYNDPKLNQSDYNNGIQELVKNYGASYIIGVKGEEQMNNYLDAITKKIIDN